jgi:hypothetical protein
MFNLNGSSIITIGHVLKLNDSKLLTLSYFRFSSGEEKLSRVYACLMAFF